MRHRRRRPLDGLPTAPTAGPPHTLRGPVAVLLGLLLIAAGPVPAAYAADGGRAPHGRTAALADALYWTADRMAAALPADSGKPAVPEAAAAAVPPSRPFNGLPQVGTFFWTDGRNTGRFCGGTVVRSPHRNLVVSAAHCLRSPDPKKHLSFVPQYHDRKKPHGVFPVDDIYIDQRYYDLGTGGGARWDYAVVRLAPRQDGREAQSVVGGFDLVAYPGYAHRKVRLIGYPGSSDAKYPKPLDCTSSTHRFRSKDPNAPGDFLEIACAGYIGGTSGGPFLRRAGGGYELIGVIGGYHTGGDTPDISYSSYFTDDLVSLYLHAIEGDDND
ncbi:trypsin-like serine peptidase [Streptomyces gamaensis]|uniref:Trypsin-like serine peptidase n=1 Tax=Streptomyces gamaensis TaxID=1763542 RepID=A0ABW0YZ67_9ACTN